MIAESKFKIGESITHLLGESQGSIALFLPLQKFIQWCSNDCKVWNSRSVKIDCTQEWFQTFYCSWFGIVFYGLEFFMLGPSSPMRYPQNLTSEQPKTVFFGLIFWSASWNFWNNCRRCDSCSSGVAEKTRKSSTYPCTLSRSEVNQSVKRCMLWGLLDKPKQQRV